MATNMNDLSLSLLTPPGETLQEILSTKNISQKELAIRTGLTTKHINQIINGNKSLTYSTAIKLENALGIPASFWNTLEANYCEEKLKIQELNCITQKEINCLKLIPHKELKRLGFLEKKLESIFLVEQLRRFFNISNLLNLPKLANQIAFRTPIKVKHNFYALLAWIRMCEIGTSAIEVKEYDVKRVNFLLPEIKNIMMLDINIAIERLTTLFSKCGIAFKVTPNLPDVPAQGLIKKFSNKVILCLTIKNKYTDVFWFTLLHEIGHLLNDDFHNLFVDLDTSSRELNEKEKRADHFANDFLIPKKEYHSFILKNDFSKNSIIAFAKAENIIPGIVVSRLQNDKIVSKSWCNELKVKYS